MTITLIRLRAYLPIWHLQLESRGPSAHYRLYVWQKLEVDLWQLILPFYNKGKQKRFFFNLVENKLEIFIRLH